MKAKDNTIRFLQKFRIGLSPQQRQNGCSSVSRFTITQLVFQFGRAQPYRDRAGGAGYRSDRRFPLRVKLSGLHTMVREQYAGKNYEYDKQHI
ncbi:MAG TPA: hypothetical protein DEB40_07350 [Elusimicrobia bacterium]|nr:hypothetical protein [Elusimicrobiota bacterium]HBT61543.1 hypothetical protein [Elusimicrobiota bacterium]